MYRASLLGDTWFIYGPFEDLEDQVDHIRDLVESGDLVVLGNDLETLKELAEEHQDVEIVEPD